MGTCPPRLGMVLNSALAAHPARPSAGPRHGRARGAGQGQTHFQAPFQRPPTQSHHGPGRRVSLSPLPLRRRVWAHGPAAAPAPCYAKVRPAHRQSRLLRKNDSQETPEGVQCLPAQSGASAPCSPPMPRGLTSWARRGPLSTLFPVALGRGPPPTAPTVSGLRSGLTVWNCGVVAPWGHVGVSSPVASWLGRGACSRQTPLPRASSHSSRLGVPQRDGHH